MPPSPVRSLRLRHLGPVGVLPWLLSALLLLFSALPGSAQSTGDVRGRLLDATNQRPLGGALVRVEGTQLRAITNEGGLFQFAGVPAGSVTVVAELLGYAAGTVTATLPAGGTLMQDLLLQPSAVTLGGLVVTSQRRSQSILDVPVAITALEGPFLTDLGVQEFDALSAYVPGLEVQIQSANNPGFVVRGITSDSGDSRVEPRVSVFQDGVSISKSRGSVVEVFDMERVEVLKGPQGTLFGRSAQIGAVHLIQNKAGDELGGEITVGPGNLGELYASGFVNAPLVPGVLNGRIAGVLARRDGFVENLSGGDLNGKETVALRGSLRWRPTEGTTADLIVNWQQDTPPGTSFRSGTYAPAGGTLSPFDPASLERGDDLFLDRTVQGATLLVEQQLAPSWTLNSATAWREFDSFESFDADGTAAPVLWFAEDSQGEQFSQEFRVNFNNGGRFSGFAGAGLFREEGSQRVPWETDERSYFVLLTPLLAAAGVPVPALPLVNPNGSVNQPFQVNPLNGVPFKPFHTETSTNFGELTAYEIFLDGTLQVTDRLDLTAGLRGTREDVTGALEVQGDATPGTLGFILGTGTNNLFAPTNGRREGNDTFTSLVGRFVGSFALDADSRLFASVSRGRRPNVINVTSTAVNVLSDETVLSYEAGIRGIGGGGTIQYDLNGFWYDYSNFQTSVAELTEDGLRTETRDSGSATGRGVEAALRFAPTRALSAFVNGGWVDATFDDEDSDGRPQALAGNRFRLTPEWSFSAGADWRSELGNVGSLSIRPDYTWKSQVFFEEQNQPGIEQEGYGLLNLRATWTLPGERFSVTGWARNVLDKEFIIDAGNTGGAFGIPTFIAGAPRLFGVRLSAAF